MFVYDTIQTKLSFYVYFNDVYFLKTVVVVRFVLFKATLIFILSCVTDMMYILIINM